VVYKYKLDSRPKIEPWGKFREKEPATPEGLTGFIRGRRASSLEERFARALDKAGQIDEYWFDVLVRTPFTLPGQENRVDFFVWIGRVLHPIEIDGGFVHKSAEAKSDDLKRDAILNPIIAKEWPPALPIERIPGFYAEDQQTIDRIVREMM
jgi:hypothetical protein